MSCWYAYISGKTNTVKTCQTVPTFIIQYKGIIDLDTTTCDKHKEALLFYLEGREKEIKPIEKRTQI
jgi:hypothetical protein